MNERTPPLRHLVPMLLTGLVLAAILALPRWAEEPVVASKKTDERIEALERGQKRMGETLRDQDARLILMEEMRGEVRESMERVLPADARWVPLKPGGSEQWDFAVGGRAQVQFVEADEEGGFVFRIVSRAGEVNLPLRPGWAIRAVDDQGDRRQIYTTTMHQLAADRTGRPERALLSVVVTVE
jgi:hypothetical protein